MPVITPSRPLFAAAILVAVPALALAQTIPGLPPVPQPDHTALLKNPDGTWKYTNRLIDTDSPYLLQHAHNPVDWYSWGADALAAAKEQDKPIFLSVGYSTCYWCHVMEREVFSNPAIAAIMNERFINIKVDREQRPDLDQIYMTTTQLLTGRGGWPNSVFLTPDLKPFWAATYIGPEDIPGPPGQPARPGFPTVISALSDYWINQRETVESRADQIATAVVSVLNNQDASATTAALSPAIPDAAIEQLVSSYDAVNGGFGVAPKFPSDFTYSFLFRAHERTGDERTLEMAFNTLRHMAAGGLYDHVGGGFHRYSTDGQWQVPHFEKMLYNQGQLVRAYLEAYERTGDEFYADVARDILRYVDRRMSDAAGPFYSALDAETDAVEGAYYVWNRGQIESLLDEEQLALFDGVFLLAEVPIFPGHKHPDGGVLCMRLPLAEAAENRETTPAELTASLAPILSALEAARTPRSLPRLDDKAIVAWNGLMIDAYALAGRVLGDDGYTARARAAADFILEAMRDDAGRLQRVWRSGQTSQDAFLEDYAFLAAGLITLYRTTGDDRYLESTIELVAQADALFWDESEDGGGGYFVAADTADLIARPKSAGDMAIPSGNSVMAHNLLDLAELTGDDGYADRARVLLGAFAEQMTQFPASHVHMVHAVERLLAREPRAIPMTPILPMDVFQPPDTGDDPGRGLADSSARVDVSAGVDRASLKPGESFVVTVTLGLDEGWHVNANPASAAYLIPTVADVRSDLPVTVTDVEYPTAHEISLAGEPIKVYETGTSIRISCVLADDAPEGPGTLRVVVGYQACDDQSCLAPAESMVEVAVTVGPRPQPDRTSDGWVSLFNGEDLTGWTPKFTGHELGVNVDDTFRVEDGVLKVAYGPDAKFDGTFGHLFYKTPYSHYVLRLEYRFTGEPVSGAPGWAYRNNGVMIHGQPPETMGLGQSFPVSIEVQLLGGDGEHERPTANLCTPGTNVVMDGTLVTRHCTNSRSKTYHGDQWVTLEIEVRGNELIRHKVNGEVVMEYTRPQLDMNDAHAKAWVAAHNEANPDDPLDTMLSGGTISLQAEWHPCEFRTIELRVLEEK